MKNFWEVKCDDGVLYYLENGTGTERRFSKENKFNKEYHIKWAQRLNEETA